MSGSLFDPARMKGPPPDGPPARRERAADKPWTVTQLSAVIKQTLEERIPSPVRVIGEVSNFNERNHWYFSLKDDGAVISSVMWASAARRMAFTPADGQAVVASGHISHFAPQGRTQLYVDRLEPVGAGALDLQFRRLCEELRGLGYFDAAHKRPLPLFPRRIAVITSATGAALHDVLNTIQHRCPAVSVLVVDARVQGDGAAAQISRTIRHLDQSADRLGIDAIMLTRGGGSIEDLWAFNERAVADAIYHCHLPIIAAIGHESDTTIAELVADVRAATPTQAAMRLVPDRVEMQRQVDHLADRLTSQLRRRIDFGRERLSGLLRHAVFRSPGAVVHQHRERLDGRSRELAVLTARLLDRATLRIERLSARLLQHRPVRVAEKLNARLAVAADRLERSVQRGLDQRARMLASTDELERIMQRRLQRHHESLAWQERTLQAVEVHGVLRRGFSYTRLTDGRIVRSIDEVAAGDSMVTHVRDGTIRSVVGDRMGRSRRPRRSDDDGLDQMDLFSKE